MIMGILNVTPDSFSDGGRYQDVIPALEHARSMIAEGAEIIDVGGESTRPGAGPVTTSEELRRTIPIIEALRAEWDGLISIDTSKAEVAQMALAAGADIVNDVSGLRGDAGMIDLCGESGCGLVVMHMQGQPRTMQASPRYDNVAGEVRGFFEERYEALTASGIDAECLCFDPGIGFGKTLDHNLALLAHLDELAVRGRPLLIGLSRKSFIGKVLGDDSPALREWPTVALTAAARLQGVLLHRVHAVRGNRDALRMAEAVLEGGLPGVNEPS
jgi:dihydropteroate synthase